MANTMKVAFSVDKASVDFTSRLSGPTDVSSSANPCDPQCRLVHTHWVEPVQHDHDYCKTDSAEDVHDKKMQRNEIGYFLLKNDQMALFYTGIALKVFNILVSSLEGYASHEFTFMSVRDQVLLTLIKLKSNREISVLSNLFFWVSENCASKIISYWIDKLEEVLHPLIRWLPKETIQATMPAAFKNSPNTTCILQCCKSFVQKPQNLGPRWELHEKYYDTVKYVVAVAPCGLIMFISAVYGGRCSDKFITIDSGLLNKFKPGDEIMAELGSSIQELLFLKRHVKLMKPSSTTEAQTTGHMERALSSLKVYKMASHVSDNMAPKMNKILRICSALANLR